MDREGSFHDAKRLYLESCGDPMVTNTYLKIALAMLSIVCVALAFIDLRTDRKSTRLNSSHELKSRMPSSA